MKNRVLDSKTFLLQEIEKRLDWGDNSDWTSKDFEELSERIFQKTGSKLSVATLKRVWGRTNITSNLSNSTLDILAQFVDFENWRSYKQTERVEPTGNKQRQKFRPLWKRGLVVFFGLTLAIPFFWIQFKDSVASRKALPELAGNNIEFELEKVSIGYPNTVIFRYDIGNTPYDTLEIQQSWDQNKRIRLNAHKGLATTTYYHPGYYLTKLVLNNKIIAEKNLYIPTHGWRAGIRDDRQLNIYLNKKQLIQDSIIHFREDVWAEINKHNSSKLSLMNLAADPKINSANFEFDTRFQLSKPKEQSICQNVSIIIFGTKQVLGFNFSIPGCVGDLSFFLNGQMILGRNNDLSAFGMDLTRWTGFKLISKDNKLNVYINDNKVFEHQLESDIGPVGGVGYTFDGVGKVKSARFRDTEQNVDLLLSTTR